MVGRLPLNFLPTSTMARTILVLSPFTFRVEVEATTPYSTFLISMVDKKLVETDSRHLLTP